MATQAPTLSVVVNTKNSAATLKACLNSVKSIADEIIVMDMHSDDRTVEIAKNFRAKVFYHPDVGYVEPARNAAIGKATGDWVLILDSDETIPPSLATEIRETLILDPKTDAYFLPRKNIIFGKWVKTGWWPDYVLRLFKPNLVVWSNEIHSTPQISGTAERLPESEKLAIVHENYQTVDQFIDRAQRYGRIVATNQHENKKTTPDPLKNFFSEFLRRYFQWDGQNDGAHGYYLSVLQGLTAVLESAYLWEKKEFSSAKKQVKISGLLAEMAREARYWELTNKVNASSGILRWYWKGRRWLSR
ncbi:glycosyltransferase family 2 protein [Candidatus Woesebacteria bacterium]|nr:glycosyltransferase family 2 protein [Candidatus Woesebacteria bacterium]MCD8507172.1 glycosyltransferase family 2 protein [Candidatus Woesebacteria bacterium]MCD8527063.1 glycosyltransferase family 2 protein [Candidatus Woesebacteria bacterium]MCD8545935.1 glycosyltransferase family 2 protein [Candidatus Woesebacteria bacterium]